MIQEITVSEKNVLVSLSGSIYVEEAAQIRESLIGYIDNGHKTFIVDLSNVDYIDSRHVSGGFCYCRAVYLNISGKDSHLGSSP